MKKRYPRFSRVALMDLRAWVAALFFTFGMMLTVYGLCFVTQEDVAKAAGVNLDLWTGLGMLVFAMAFLVWLMARPPEVGEAKIGDPAEEVDYMFLPIRSQGEVSGDAGLSVHGEGEDE